MSMLGMYRRVATSVAIGLCSHGAVAQWHWTATVLHPTGATRSETWAVWGDLQGGSVFAGLATRPGIWQGASQTWMPLASGPIDNGHVRGMGESVQVGDIGGFATLWRGTAQSAVSLHPLGGPSGLLSIALSTRGDQQAGYTDDGVSINAALWRGSAGSYVNLHPPGARFSTATATDGTRQGGWVDLQVPGGLIKHAALWAGTSSWIDLNPGPTYDSRVAGMAPGVQVGYAKSTTSQEHAAVWRGSAASFEDWHPSIAGYSQLRATTGEFHAGLGGVVGSVAQVALAWLGSPQNVVNLQSFLPSNYYLSEATSIWAGDGRIVVGGWANDSITLQRHAVMWVGVPAPGAAVLPLAGAILAMRRRRPYARLSSGETSSAVLG